MDTSWSCGHVGQGAAKSRAAPWAELEPWVTLAEAVGSHGQSQSHSTWFRQAEQGWRHCWRMQVRLLGQLMHSDWPPCLQFPMLLNARISILRLFNFFFLFSFSSFFVVSFFPPSLFSPLSFYSFSVQYLSTAEKSVLFISLTPLFFYIYICWLHFLVNIQFFP